MTTDPSEVPPFTFMLISSEVSGSEVLLSSVGAFLPPPKMLPLTTVFEPWYPTVMVTDFSTYVGASIPAP